MKLACLQQLESAWMAEGGTSNIMETQAVLQVSGESDEQTLLPGEWCPLPEGESGEAPLDPAPTVLSQR